MTIKRLLSLALLLAASAVMANNLQITNVVIKGRDNATAFIQFDIRWENSWRHSSGETTPYFHDAAWVFFKVQPAGETNWYHAVLDGSGSNPNDFSSGSGTALEFVVPDDGVGFFLRRRQDGVGTTDAQKVRAVWNFANNGLTKQSNVSVHAFGIEMVYVAQGSFYVGSQYDNYLYASFRDGGVGGPFYITSEGEIALGLDPGELFVNRVSGYEENPETVPISADFPKGYNPFYCMKYELSQGQYAAFLNTLTRAQQSTRSGTTTIGCYMPDNAAASPKRGTIKLDDDPGDSLPRVYVAEAPDRAANWLSWRDLGAFLDWAGLRPMTEFEFEKACRGPLMPYVGASSEFAWGTSSAPYISGITGVDGSGTEINYPPESNLNTANIGGPVRVGIFARPDTTTRYNAGASYWGIMELSGNVWERAVATFTASGRAYTGTHGDGTLNSGGDFNVVGWSGMYANFIGYRGGHFGGDWTLNMVSDRKYGSIDFDSREAGNGGRGVRTAPVADPPGAHTLEETESPRWAGGAYDGWAEARQDGFSDMRLNAGTILCVW